MEGLLLLGEQPRVRGRHCCPVLLMGSSVCVKVPLSLEWICYFQRRLVPCQGVVLSSFLPALPTPKAGSNHRVAVSGGGPAGSLSDQKAAVAVHSTSPAPLLWPCFIGGPSGSGTDDGEEETGQGRQWWRGYVPATWLLPWVP